MDASKVVGNINPEVPVHSTRIRVGRNIDGFGLSPGITKQQRIDIEKLMSSALSKLTGDLAGTYYHHVDLPGWTKEGVDKLKARCEELAVQPRGTRGESGGQTG